MQKGQLFFVAVLAASSFTGPTQADVLLIDAIAEAPANTSDGLPRPSRGMTMKQVRTQFGAPATEHPRVGDPPITRWDYARYSVFFEYDHVLDTVVHREP